MTEKTEKRENSRINGWLEKFAFAVISIGVSLTATFQWQMYQDAIVDRASAAKESQEIRQLLGQHNARIMSMELEISAIRGNMVGWDVLKRMELMLSARSPKDVESELTRVIRAEIKGREK